MPLKTCAARVILLTEKLPKDFGRYWMAHGPFELQLPPYLDTAVLQSVL